MDEEQVIPAPEAPEPDNQELSSMNKLLLPLFIFLLLVVIAGVFFIRAQRESSLPSPTPTLEATPLESPSPEVSPTGSPKASPSPTPTKSPSPTPTKSPTSSPTS